MQAEFTVPLPQDQLLLVTLAVCVHACVRSFVCVCVVCVLCVCACVRVVCACVRVVRVCVRALCVCLCAHVRACVPACVCV